MAPVESRRGDNGDGTYTGAYDESTQPSVSVDQTANLVDQVVNVSWANFTPSFQRPELCRGSRNGWSIAQASVMYGVWVFECRGTSVTQNPLGRTDSQCYPDVAASGAVDGGHGENDGVQAVTQADGSGSVPFHVENKVSNDLLGCDATHPCSIVVVPNNGGLQPTTGSDGTTACDDHSQDVLAPLNYDQAQTADLTHLGGPCAWADRFVIPIHFAALPTDCPNTASQLTAVGSPMLARGLNQLLAGWCRGSSPVSITYNSTSDEYEAREQFLAAGGGALTSSTDLALVSQPADQGSYSARSFTYAPIANDAIDITYYVDNAVTARPITDLRLNAELVAKLLTQSYQPQLYNCQSATDPSKSGYGCAPEVRGNPASIFDDPQFQALNFRGDHNGRQFFRVRPWSAIRTRSARIFPSSLPATVT